VNWPGWYILRIAHSFRYQLTL